MVLHLAAALRAVAAPVGEANALGVAAGSGDHGQVLRVHGRAAHRGRDRHRSEGADAPAQVRRQHLLDLDQRPDRALLDPGDRGAGRSAEADCDRDRLVVVQEQRGHRGPGAKPVAAGGAGARFHGVAELSEPLDVAPDRPPRHFQAIGELCGLPITAALEQREQG